MKKLLVVVDMQHDFLTGALQNPDAEAVLPAVRARIARARAEGECVVFTRDTHGADYLSTREGRLLPVPHCLKATPGWELAEGLAGPGEKIFDKTSFASLELAGWAAAEGFGAVELIGVCTDICVISNAFALKAALPEAEIEVNAACCAGVTPQAHRTALEAMRACQITVLEG